ncbi:phosphatidylglycerophosphatase A [Methanococcus vannielii SB]|uniref:Phosphatidylglycerophosphatase A n=1 Tax=Methanococcus vannielii (strain ATCC 35089 / DSM 1224 / JCM 13029 / OCM 148 / SB) TaxID=406327 RepID=A6UQP2_METVS|nr:phosphatidylglycerophosphatase A [Methanococcus vannielii]ABR54814.1 phosphatidylglycerophosphatase A [Methanococcus vannielii SB]
MNDSLNNSCDSLNKNMLENDVLKLLSNKGVNFQNMVKCAMYMCICEESEKKQIEKKVLEIMKLQIKNPNVSTLLIAAIILDERGKLGGLPFNYEDDPTYVYADEVIGMAIANEIAGTKATFNFKWYDAKKPGIIGKLDRDGYMFLDDAVAGFVSGCMSKTFE